MRYSPIYETMQSAGVPGALLLNSAPNSLVRLGSIQMGFSFSRSCPSCGKADIKPASSRPVYNLMDPAGQQPPISTLHSYECECGHAFAEAIPHTSDPPGATDGPSISN